MLNRYLLILFQSTCGIYMGVALENMLALREKAPHRIFCILGWFAMFLINTCGKVLLGEKPLLPIMHLFFWGSAILMLAVWYKGKVWLKTLAMISLFFAVATADLVILFMPRLLGIPALSMDFSKFDMLVSSFVGQIVSIVAIHFVLFIWQKVRRKSTVLRHPWIVVPLAMCMAVPTFRYDMQAIQTSGRQVAGNLFSMIVAFALSILLFVIMTDQANKEAAEQELFQVKYLTQLERQHHQQIMKRSEELSKIRHDYRNFLASFAVLLKEERYTEAEEAVSHLAARVESTRDLQYCEVPIVNAILSEKETACRQQSIELAVDLQFPEETGVSPIDLCSIFSNILDNGIRACLHLPEKQSRTITITAGYLGDYLIIRCRNPSCKPDEKNTPSGSGYGMKILQDIADRYDGELTAIYRDGVFFTDLILLPRVEQ